MKRTTQKKPLNKLPPNLPVYNYNKFSDEDKDRAYDYFKKELEKVEKILTDKIVKAAKRVGLSINNTQQSVSSVSNPYMDIYNRQPNVSQYNNQVKPPTSKPEVVAPPLPYQSYTSGLQGDHMEMPSILGTSGVVVNTLKENYQESPTTFNGIVETTKLPIVKDNSAELIAELKNLINPTN